MLMGARGRRGFTLIETVVTVGIVATLAAVVVPQVVKQFDAADPTKAAEDLNSIRTGIEVFGVNVRPQQPGDIEDLVNRVEDASAGELTVLGAQYSLTDEAAWNGPYLGLSIAAGTSLNVTVLTTGFGAQVQNGLGRYDVGITDPRGCGFRCCPNQEPFGSGIFVTQRADRRSKRRHHRCCWQRFKRTNTWATPLPLFQSPRSSRR
jgi:prepilin-type N-terminal cleavage/methylation domain-containing protein